MAADLTPENFIKKIKSMNRAEQNQLKLKDILDLIMKAPLFTYDDNATIQNIQTQLASLSAESKSTKELATKNQEELAMLKVTNARLEKNNTDLQNEINTLKQRNEDGAAVGENAFNTSK